MRIECSHTLGKEEAIRRIDQWLEALRRETIPGGFKIEDFSKEWTDNVLKLSCRVKKLFFGATIAATVTVNESAVVIEFEPPGFLKALISEEKMQQEVGGKVVALLT